MAFAAGELIQRHYALAECRVSLHELALHFERALM